MCEGKRCSYGNANPVTLVATVVRRKMAVHRSSRFPASNPYITTNPVPIPTRLSNTCTSVNVEVVIPRIMAHLLPQQRFLRYSPRYIFIRVADHVVGILHSASSGQAL